MSNMSGRTLGPYTLETPLGKGGMATVYRAYQSSVRRYVAVKVMAGEIAGDPGFIERFKREAEIVANLEHPHILPVIDFGVAENLPYIVMRYMEGGSLDDRMGKRQMPLEDIATYLHQIAAALDYAHRRGVVHRDLKPNNVLLDNDNNCYLTDFGIARIEGSERKLTATGTVMGTPAYMSPEQAMGRPVDGRSDLYTLGVMIYEMVVGKLPFTSDTPAGLIFQHVYELPPPPQTIRPDLPPELAGVLERSMAKSPDMRYQSGIEMARAFEAAIRGVDTTASGKLPMPSDKTFVATTPPPTRAAPATPPGAAPTNLMPPSGAPMSGAKVSMPAGDYAAPAPARRGLPLALIGGVLAVLILGGGGIALVTTTNNANANSTATAVAIAADLSKTPLATHTPTATETSSPTPTITLSPTASETPTASPTPTIDATGTQFAVGLATINAFSAQQTSTLEAIQTRAALDVTATHESIVGATATALANQIATIAAFNANQTATVSAATAFAETATAEAIATGTARALLPTKTPTIPFDPLGTLTAAAVTMQAQPSATPRTPTGGTPLANQNLADLSSNDPDKIYNALVAGGFVPASKTALVVPPSDSKLDLTGSTDVENIFYFKQLGRALYYDMVMSLDIVAEGSANGNDKTACGVYVAGRNEVVSSSNFLEDMDFLAVYFYRSRQFRADFRASGKWASSALEFGRVASLNPASGDTNRMTVVAVNGQISVFVNGRQIIGRSVKEYAGGMIGLFMIRGVTGDAERCTFSNFNIWRLN